MKVLFAATSSFAVPTLEHLIASEHEVLAVITQPDKPSGRGKSISNNPVKEIAIQYNIPVLQPIKINSPESIQEIKDFNVDAVVVVAYGQKISKELLEWPKYGMVNVHGSLLPKYRGAAPIQHAIMAGESVTGVTTMLMDEGWDTGDMLLQRTYNINPNENAAELASSLSIIGAELLIETLNEIEKDELKPIPQNNDNASYSPSLKPNAGTIDWNQPASNIVNLIRGCTPKPGAFTKLFSINVKIWDAKALQYSSKIETGEVVEVSKEGIIVSCGDGCILIKELQPESRKRMFAVDFARGIKK